jgi:branched-chain amino acid transport system substrate-binding protein
MLLTPFSADAQDDLTVNFVSTYQKQYNETPNQFAADAYDCIYALYQACTAAGITADMSAQTINDLLVSQFNTMTFNGLTGTDMTWSNGYVSKYPKGMVIENGVYVGLD